MPMPLSLLPRPSAVPLLSPPSPRTPPRWRSGVGACVFAVAALGGSALAQAVPLLQPLVPGSGDDGTPPAPWATVLLPGQRVPATRYHMVRVDGQPALRIEADGSYGNLVHPLDGAAGRGTLAWRWRVDLANPAADLRRREADDTSVKVCVLFDLPLARVPFVERQLLRLARSRSPVPLPAATVCYVWDARLPVGTRIDNVYSRRVRTLVLRSGPAPAGQPWATERRDIAADFGLLFGDESPQQVPPLLAVAVGADADNTGGRSLAHLGDLELRP